TVTFMDGSTTLGTAVAPDPSTDPAFPGQARFSISTLAVGVHQITAVYAGNNNFNGDSTNAPLVQRVTQDNSVTIMSSSANPSPFGSAVTFYAAASAQAPGSGIPTGTITFKEGNTTLGTGTLDATGNTSYTTSGLSKGNHSITAVYSGDGNFNS